MIISKYDAKYRFVSGIEHGSGLCPLVQEYSPMRMALVMAPCRMLLLLLVMQLAFKQLGGLQTTNAEKTRRFIISNDSFLKDGKPFRIFGGEVHYFRTVPQYWEDRLLRAKALGLNTVQTYVPWNAHEPSQGSFNFGSPVDLEAFLKLAQALDLTVMLRIGPYVCGEWDLGGLPSWLLSKQPQLELRTSDAAYLQLVDEWWSVLLPKLGPFLYSQGGPVIMVQIENEYGSYGSNKDYLHHLATQARKHLGDDVLLYTTDGATEEALKGGTIVEDNVYAAIDFSTGWDPVAAFALQKKYNLPGKSPPLSAEFYTGWLTHWGEELARTSANDTAAELDRLLRANGSVVLYMAHGGSNFGFFSGANTGTGQADYQPDLTSYDYDAPIGEAGDVGQKFNALREVFAKYIATPLPDPPILPARKAYGMLTLQKLASLFEVLENLSHGQKLQMPVAMEMLNQVSGFIVYRSTLPNHAKAGSILSIGEIHDRAQVFIGPSIKSLTFVGTIERWSNSSLPLISVSCPGLQLYILVENMGRVNYGPYLYDQKGILSPVMLDNVPITDWIAYPLSLTNAWSTLERMQTITMDQTHVGLKLSSLQKKNAKRSVPSYQEPAFYSGMFQTDSQADTFVSMKGWRKGIVYVNGFNLGRFWPSAGPQCTLYVPGPLLQRGQNKLMILELESPRADNTLEKEYERCKATHSVMRFARQKSLITPQVMQMQPGLPRIHTDSPVPVKVMLNFMLSSLQKKNAKRPGSKL